MKGEVLLFDKNTNRGIITDKNQNKYYFHLGEWLSDEKIEKGEKVSFNIPHNEAIDIYINKKKTFINRLKSLFKLQKEKL
jgi:cold shock CspA family protein